MRKDGMLDKTLTARTKSCIGIHRTSTTSPSKNPFYKIHVGKFLFNFLIFFFFCKYERWQPRARYKLALDPTTEDIQKLASSLRRAAKGDRVLFHYNGRGVPKPTTNAEIWVFNNVNKIVPFILLSISHTIKLSSLLHTSRIFFPFHTIFI